MILNYVKVFKEIIKKKEELIKKKIKIRKAEMRGNSK